MAAECIMVQGTMSGAGKSLLTAALCRIFLQDGLRVAPFKSQNMALNSYVTPDGLELGRAQAMQAEAAGLECDVRMNPILLKPSSEMGSQVIVNGEVRGQYSAKEYFRMKKSLIPDILSAYRSLAEENDVIVIEGAGSPAEINLREDDIVNMGLAELVDAPVLLTGDIDRGGVFAQLYGTVALLRPEERNRLAGLVINKFRGDLSLLQPGLRQIEELTQIPVVGVVPFLNVDLDEEDSLAPMLSAREKQGEIDIAVIRLPHISNFTDFAPLCDHPSLGLRFVDRPGQLGVPDLLILPGTKNTMGDLLWLRNAGLEQEILARRAFRFSGSAAVFRCSVRSCTIPQVLSYRGVCPGSAYSRAARYSRSARRVPELSVSAFMGLLPVPRWKDMKSIWVQRNPTPPHPSAVFRTGGKTEPWKALFSVPICMAFLTARRLSTGLLPGSVPAKA